MRTQSGEPVFSGAIGGFFIGWAIQLLKLDFWPTVLLVIVAAAVWSLATYDWRREHLGW